MMMKKYVMLRRDYSNEMTEIDPVGVYFHLLFGENEVNYIALFYITPLNVKKMI